MRKISSIFMVPFLFMAVILALPGSAEPDAGNSARENSVSDWYDGLDQLFRLVVTTDTGDTMLGTAVRYQSAATDEAVRAVVKKLRKDLLRIRAPEKGHSKIAFWLNVYNFTALSAVLDHWPVESIRDLHWLPFRVWSQIKVKVGRQEYSLHFIEHEILRKMGEPRIHFALNCASRSCPDLLPVAYRAESLAETLAAQTGTFLSQPEKGLRKEGDVCRISSLFDWFAEDFGNVDQWLYSNGVSRTTCPGIAGDSFLDYDWALNRVKTQPGN